MKTPSIDKGLVALRSWRTCLRVSAKKGEKWSSDLGLHPQSVCVPPAPCWVVEIGLLLPALGIHIQPLSMIRRPSMASPCLFHQHCPLLLGPSASLGTLGCHLGVWTVWERLPDQLPGSASAYGHRSFTHWVWPWGFPHSWGSCVPGCCFFMVSSVFSALGT